MKSGSPLFMKPLVVDSATALRPVGKMLVVRRDDPETMIGAIHLPAGDVEAPDTGTLIAFGPGVDFELEKPFTMNEVVGKRVAFTHYGGTDWDKRHTILRQEDIMCFIEELPE